MDNNKFCNSIFNYKRYLTREVNIGGVPVGGDNPVRIQSMTTTDTMDTKGTVEQTIRMVDAGCEYVRITAPSKKDAANLENIQNELLAKGVNVPLIADIHFTPNAAEVAAKLIAKVRVNPGNYIDKKKFAQIEYTDEEYNEEIERIREKFSPLVKICREQGTAIRIGTNHGSLSDRIMSRYGDTPYGMVESALEFVRICRDLDYHDIVLSMKASNVQVMVQAYRLLINKLEQEGMSYPLHLGVTEAGDGEDGRIKSAVGIGTLLEDGIGDTIRVSLTEEPEAEVPVAIMLAERYKNRGEHNPITEVPNNFDFFNYTKRVSESITNIGGDNVPVVAADFSYKNNIEIEDFDAAGYHYNPELDKWQLKDFACDIVFAGNNKLGFEAPQNVKVVYNYSIWKEFKKGCFPYFNNLEKFLNAESKSSFLNFIGLNIHTYSEDLVKKLAGAKNIVFVLQTNNLHGMAEQRSLFLRMLNDNIKTPVIIKREYENLSYEQQLVYPATDLGALFIDGFGDGTWITNKSGANQDVETLNRVSFGLLQACRARISKTEYIACPSCGRTLFDLVEVTNKIRSRTSHLVGVKIGIMGCIVNGPGEMADADFGYVGSGVGKITLYKGKEVVKRNIPSAVAVDELIQLIKDNGRWTDPPSNI